MAESLLKSKNPLALYHKIFVEHSLTPSLESHARIKAENERKDRVIIERLDRERQSAWIKRDIRDGLLHALVGKQAHEERQVDVPLDGGGLPTPHEVVWTI